MVVEVVMEDFFCLRCRSGGWVVDIVRCEMGGYVRSGMWGSRQVGRAWRDTIMPVRLPSLRSEQLNAMYDVPSQVFLHPSGMLML